MPAALRSVAGPRALLPPLSPHLGPIVGLGAPGRYGGKDAARVGGRTARKRKARGKEREGSPELRPVRGGSPAKLSQFKRRLPEAYFAQQSGSGKIVQESLDERGGKSRNGGDRASAGPQPRFPPAPEWLRKQRLPREPPGSGAESRLRKRNKNKQLKMAATAAASPAPRRHRPERSTPARTRDSTMGAKRKGETGKEE